MGLVFSSINMERALHGPRADALNLGEPPDHFLVGQLAELGLAQAPIAEALRQIHDGSGLTPGQSETMQCPRVHNRELARIRHPTAEPLGEASENCGRGDHGDLLSDDLVNQSAEQFHWRTASA